MKFETISGSLYEVNEEENKVRRLIGVKDPTPRQGKDGEWRVYVKISSIVPGRPVMITWRIDSEEEFFWLRTTQTSAVKEIHSVEAD